ncbi:hypothetical protein [Agromyces humi]|uniref:hypothetical protein n=1 Tax=Agromyces humi TaxID=1766800 RepID=UPI00139684DA|nr:hypothetical protein [Agromyces humi]
MSTDIAPASATHRRKTFRSRLLPTRLERKMFRLADRLFDDIDFVRENAGLSENDPEFRRVVTARFGADTLARYDAWLDDLAAQQVF